MLNNRWLTGSLFLGLLIAVSLVSSIPMYTSGVMQKLLIRELEDHQVKTNEFPGIFTFSESFTSPKTENPAETFLKVEQIGREATHNVGLPILAELTMISSVPLKTTYYDEAMRESAPSQRDSKFLMISGLEDHIEIIDGRLPNDEMVDGVIEVLVSEDALQRRNMVINTPFIVSNSEHDVEFVINPVGVFRPKEDDVFWTLIPRSLGQDFIVSETWFRNELLENYEELLWVGRFSTAFDYYEITDEHFSGLLTLAGRIRAQIRNVKEVDVLFEFPISSILRSYDKKVSQMTTMLWSLNVPVLIMLAIYLYMISQLIVNRQLNEIAVLYSRGASRWQILLIYFLEITILGLIAFAIGPYIGLQLCKVLGASNGFLEFVQRSALPVELTSKAFQYAAITVAISIIMIMIPVFRSSGQSIVHRKQSQAARADGKFRWYLVIFELAILGFAIFELYSFNKRRDQLVELDIDTSELMIDPQLFFLPALFIIGVALIVLRIYPWILKLIFKIGERIWSLSLYSSFLQVGRSSKQYQFLMMFLVMTIGMGVFSASAARTINTNLEEQILYANGADIRLQTRWQSNLPPPSMGPGFESPDQERRDELPGEEEVVYTEPPFEPIANLPYIESTAKVFNKPNVTVTHEDRTLNYTQLMAIETKDFGETAWFKDSLMPRHWYEYLNLMAKDPTAVLISEYVAEELGVKPGDIITITWNGIDTAEFIVYGIIEYWPSFNPLAKVPVGRDEEVPASLIVAHLPYVQMMLGLEPYEVWIKLEPDTSRMAFYEAIEEAGILVEYMSDVGPQITELKNSALLLGVNGAMTMGFLVSLLISLIGFLLYWILTMQSRTLQYGIYRAMGISMFSIIGMLITEQIFTSGIACILGMIIGGVTSLLYVPLFKISLNIDKMVPPFRAVANASDEMKIYIFTIAMLVIGSAILIGYLRRIKIAQAIKLGED